LALFLCAAVGCGSTNTAAEGADAPAGVHLAKSALARQQSPSDAHVKELAESNRAFGFNLYKKLSAEQPRTNLVVSPHSISTALAMTYAGARTMTEFEMKSALHFDLPHDELHEAFNALDLALHARGAGQEGADGTPFRLNVDNSLWAQRDYPIEAAYLDTLALNYDAGVFLTDFWNDADGSRRAINDWVSQRTEQLIPELLDANAIDTATTFVLTNTVYFNASWQTKFNADATSPMPFTKLDGSQVSAPSMRAVLEVPYAEADGYQAVALPYAGGELSFVAVLPAAGTFEALENKLEVSFFAKLDGALKNQNVSVSLPKLDFKFHASLKPALEELGMRSAFESADFSGLSRGDVYIDDVVQEAVIKVIEGGTIAAAATAVVFDKHAIDVDHELKIDRPFLFAIIDKPSGALLFLGRVLDPSAGEN
jgi:serpin B